MRPTWIVEPGVFEENEEALIEHIGTNIHWFGKAGHIKTLPKGIFYGSIQLGRQIRRKRPDILTWLDDNWYDVNKYGQFLGDEFVNKIHTASPLYTLRDHWLLYGDFFGDTGLELDKRRTFIKSYSGYKQLTGFLVSGYNDFVEKTKLCDDDHMIMLAPDQSQKLGREWRVVVDWRDGEYFPLTLDRYEEADNKPYLAIKAPPQHYLKHSVLPKLANSYLPPMFTIDVCEYGTPGDSRYKVMEINSLLSAGWYDCDVKRIVKAVEYWYGQTKCK